MGDINQYFSRHEFACNCGCGQDVVDAELMQVLVDVREHFGEPVTITSGNRCIWWNGHEGGGRESQHQYSRASDIVVRNFSAKQVADYLESKYPDRYGIGRYDGWTHIDVRSGCARWTN